MGWMTYQSLETARQAHRMIEDDMRRSGWDILGEGKTDFGRHAWYAVDNGHGRREIVLFLVQPGREGVSVKEMSESMGPFYADCPLSLFSLFPPVNDSAASWREQVKARHGVRRVAAGRTYPVGSRVLVYGRPFEVIAIPAGRRRSYRLRGEDGRVYKASAEIITL